MRPLSLLFLFAVALTAISCESRRTREEIEADFANRKSSTNAEDSILYSREEQHAKISDNANDFKKKSLEEIEKEEAAKKVAEEAAKKKAEAERAKEKRDNSEAEQEKPTDIDEGEAMSPEPVPTANTNNGEPRKSDTTVDGQAQ